MHARRTLALAAALLALPTASAAAAGPGSVFPVAQLDLAPGAVPFTISGWEESAAGPTDISDDGRYVAFTSTADVLSDSDDDDVTNVYRKDRQTGEVALASVGVHEEALSPHISDDGTKVAFVTNTGLDPADVDGQQDVYVRDLVAGTTTLATPGTSYDVSDFDLSGDGRYVAFTTRDALAGANDTNNADDVYRRDLQTSTTALVSRVVATGTAGNTASSKPSISDNGAKVAFRSLATNLIAFTEHDAAYQADIFVRTMTSTAVELVSSSTAGATHGSNGDEDEPTISGLGQFVSFDSSATDLVAGDTDVAWSVVRRQLGTTTTVLVSVSGGGVNADSRAHTASISDDGSRIAFASDANNLGAPASVYYGVYVRDVSAATTTRASADTGYEVQPMLAGGGGTIAWFSSTGATADADPELGAIYARDLPGGSIGLVSRPPGTAPVQSPAVRTDYDSSHTISADSRYAVFVGGSVRLPGGGAQGLWQVYRRDLRTGELTLVSRGDGVDGPAASDTVAHPTISADGNRVAFETAAPEFVPPGSQPQAVVRDIAAGRTLIASRADGASGALADEVAQQAVISGDGRYVTFLSHASNLGVTQIPVFGAHVFLRDLDAATTVAVDRASDGTPANKGAYSAMPTADGGTVVFATPATNVDPADVATNTDVFVRDVAAGTTRLVSRRSGAGGAVSTGDSQNPVISGDGRVVAFRADDEQLAPEAGSWGAHEQIVARDLTTDQNRLVSRAAGDGAPGNDDADEPSIDATGRIVAFSTMATNLLAGRGGDKYQAVVVRDLQTGEVSGPPRFGTDLAYPHQGTWQPSVSGDGQCVAFHGLGHAGLGAIGDVETSYVYVVSGACPKPAPVDAPAAGGATGTPPSTQPGAGPGQLRLTGARLTHRRFRVARRATALIAAARTPAGTTFRFTLSERATVTVALRRPTAGRRVGRSCRKPTAKLRKRRACTRWVAVGKLTRRHLAAGARRIAFSGRLGRRALKPGRYHAVLVARAADGRRSSAVTLTFRVIRR